MKTWLRSRPAFPALAVLFIIWTSVAAARERAMTMAELTASSSAVVLARITAADTVWVQAPAGSVPFIRYEARTIQTLAGTAPATFSLLVPGLVSDQRTITSIDEPAFRPGQEALLFLQPAPLAPPDRPAFRLTGSGAGALAVSPAAPGQERVIMLPAIPASPPGAPRRVGVRLSDLQKQIDAIQENKARAEAEK